MKIWRVVIVVAIVAASCSSDGGDTSASSTTATTSETTALSTVPSTSTAETPSTTTTTLLSPLDPDLVAAAPVVDVVASSTCEGFDASSASVFSPGSCEVSEQVDIEAVTFVCPTGDCAERLEMLIETRGDFSLASLNLFEAVDFRVTGDTGVLECAVRNTFTAFQLGCLDADGRLTVPPEDVWLNSEDGLRHVFGPGSNFVGTIESVTVLVTRLGVDNVGPVGTFTVLDPVMPGRVEPQRNVLTPIVDRQVDGVLQDLVPMTDEVRACVAETIGDGGDLAKLSADTGHGVGNLGDGFLVLTAGALDGCDPIIDIYTSSFREFEELSDECVTKMAEATAAEFGWSTVLRDERAIARGQLGELERAVPLTEFTAAKYEEFGCVVER